MKMNWLLVTEWSGSRSSARNDLTRRVEAVGAKARRAALAYEKRLNYGKTWEESAKIGAEIFYSVCPETYELMRERRDFAGMHENVPMLEDFK